MPVTYILHFNERYESGKASVQHYIGISGNGSAKKRLKEHGNGLVKAVKARKIGITISLEKKFDSMPEARVLEKKIKQSKNAKRFCNVCKDRG